MKTPGTWNVRFIMGKVLLGIVLAAMTGSINVVSSYGDDDHGRRDRGHDNGRYEKRGHDRDRHYYRDGRRYYREPVYRERVYVAPPPVVYAPPEPPGISFFLPSITIR